MALQINDNTPWMMSDDNIMKLEVYVLGMGDNDDSNNVLGGKKEGTRLLESIPPHLLFEFKHVLARGDVEWE